MKFRVLGQCEVIDDERRVELGSPKQRSLLALLLINHGSVVSTDRIIDELWGEDAGADHQNAVWVQVSNLRSALEPDREPRSEGSVVLTRAPGYLLDVPADDVDALRFEKLTTEGRQLVHGDPEAAAAILREALALWRGYAYEEFTYESFAQQEITRLNELRLEAVGARIDADLRVTDTDTSASAARAVHGTVDARRVSIRPPGRGAAGLPGAADPARTRNRARSVDRAAGTRAANRL